MHKSITCHSLYAIERLLVPQHRHTVVRASLLPIVVFVGLIWNLKLVAEYGFYTKFIKTEKHESHQILELLLESAYELQHAAKCTQVFFLWTKKLYFLMESYLNRNSDW